MDPKDVELHAAPITAGLCLKRKRSKDVGSQSEDEALESDEEFGWMGDDDPLNAEELVT